MESFKMIQLFAKLLQWQFQQTAHTQLLFHKHPARGGDSVKTWNHAETSYCIYEESIAVVAWCHRFPNKSAIAIALRPCYLTELSVTHGKGRGDVSRSNNATDEAEEHADKIER